MGRYRKTSQARASRRRTLDEPVVAATFHKNRRGEVVRLTLSTFNGTNILDLRQFFTSKDSGLPCPTRKGLALNVLRLPDLLDALNAAHDKAVELGLLDSEHAE